MVKNENGKLFGVPVGFFLFGILFLIVGANGGKFASIYSRPGNASSWTTSGELIDAFTYVPAIIGVSFLLLSISTFSISFYFWHKKR